MQVREALKAKHTAEDAGLNIISLFRLFVIPFYMNTTIILLALLQLTFCYMTVTNFKLYEIL